MRDKEIVSLYQAYLDVYSNSNEEVEQLDEDVQGAVKGALEKGANIMKTNPVLKAVGSIIAPANPGRKTPTATSGGYRKEEVEELDEVSDELVGRAVNKRIAATGAANDAEMRDRTPENMRASVRAGEKEASMKTAAAKRRKRINNEETDLFDTILEHLVSEGYADTNESALVIMANMSEEWRESIVEGEENKEDSQKPFTGEGPKKPKGWKPTGPKLKTGQRPGYAR